MKKLLLPALRGHVGDWTYYSCIMPLTEIGARVSYAEDIHKNERLSDMIQRELKEGRAEEIAEYLATQQQRFFNSLVLAVYDKAPRWYPITEIGGRYRDIVTGDVADEMGMLELSRSLEMFAVDGQHRLSGIKLLIEQGKASKKDQLPVVLVGHKKTLAGIERSRRLFTTLNKTAKKVQKGEIIALDEDDAAAIIVRRLVETHAYFTGAKIAYQPTNNLPPGNRVSLTTLGNLYDVSWAVLKKIRQPSGGVPDKKARPKPTVLDECESIVIDFFSSLGGRFPPVANFLKSKAPGSVVRRSRHAKGGHILFRPVGLSIFTELLADLIKTSDLEGAMDQVGKLPVDLADRPYAGILWDPGRGAMTVKGRTLTRDLLRLALGLKVKSDPLRKKLGGWLGIATRDVQVAAWVPKLRRR